MRFLRHLVILGSISLLCSGCFPVHLVTTPGISGVVLNSQTHSPVVGAQTVVSPMHHSSPSAYEVVTNIHALVVVTDTSGQFASPPQRRWSVFVAGFEGDIRPPCGALVVRCNGYEPAVSSFWSWQTATNLGNILLSPITK
jgi:hypothetical protein